MASKIAFLLFAVFVLAAAEENARAKKEIVETFVQGTDYHYNYPYAYRSYSYASTPYVSRVAYAPGYVAPVAYAPAAAAVAVHY